LAGFANGEAGIIAEEIPSRGDFTVHPTGIFPAYKTRKHRDLQGAVLR
jgi:hypothetical protein